MPRDRPRGVIMNNILFSVGLMAAAICSHANAAPFNKDAAPVGTATYQLVQDDEVKGQMVFHTRFQDGAYVIDEATAMAPDIKETGTFVLDGETFEPLRITVDADFSGNILDVDLRVSDGKASGEYRTKQPGDIEKKVTPFSLDLPKGTVTRASMFALVAALPLVDGDVYRVKWFSSLAGQLQEIDVTVTGEESVSVPAGDYDAIAVQFKNATPENTLYVSKDDRDVIRIDVPSMNMRFERMPAESTTAD